MTFTLRPHIGNMFSWLLKFVTHKKLTLVWWLRPFILYSSNANAWGLGTHIYFAHSLIWAMPMLDQRLRQAIKNFPELVMAGACLPDLAVISNTFNSTHQWQQGLKLLNTAKQTDSEEDLAIAIGYMSHLYIDVIAHQHFVPAHEALWQHDSVVTHIAAEWAMDAYLKTITPQSPSQLLQKNHIILATFVSKYFDCEVAHASTMLKRLSFWDGVLRRFKIPQLIYNTARLFDRQLKQHFIYYIALTQHAMPQIKLLLEGDAPVYDAELKAQSAMEMRLWQANCLAHLKNLTRKPIAHFNR